MERDRNSTFSPEEAIYGILSFALIAIGTEDLIDGDLDGFNYALNRMDMFQGLTLELAERYSLAFQPYVANDDWEGFLSGASAVLPKELREAAFVLSCDLVMRSGLVPSKANGYLEMLQDVLGIDDDLSSRTVFVVEIKNRGRTSNHASPPSPVVENICFFRKPSTLSTRGVREMNLASACLDAIAVLTPNLFISEPTSGDEIIKLSELADQHLDKAELTNPSATLTSETDDGTIEFNIKTLRASILLNRGLAIGLGRHEPAMGATLVEESIALLSPIGFANAHFALALLYVQTGRKAEAIQQLQEAIKLEPENSAFKEMLEMLHSESD